MTHGSLEETLKCAGVDSPVRVSHNVLQVDDQVVICVYLPELAVYHVKVLVGEIV